MPWLWTDELARMLIEETGVDPLSVDSGMRRPFAVQVPDEADRLDVARELFGITESMSGAA